MDDEEKCQMLVGGQLRLSIEKRISEWDLMRAWDEKTA